MYVFIGSVAGTMFAGGLFYVMSPRPGDFAELFQGDAIWIWPFLFGMNFITLFFVWLYERSGKDSDEDEDFPPLP